MAKYFDLKKTIRGLTFFTRRLGFFGGIQKNGDQFIFDSRGAIRITDKEVTNKNGEIIKIRSIVDAGNSDPVMIPKPNAGQFIDSAKAMASNHGWVFVALKAISDEIAGIEWRLFKVKKDGDHEEIEEHELLGFMDAVNDFQTGPEFKRMMAEHLEITGNAYILLEGVANENSKPTAMHLLNPGKVRLEINKVTYPFKIINYQFTIDGRTFIYQPYQILHIKYPDPNNSYLGLGTVQGIAEWIDNDNLATEFLRQFYDNGAQIGVTFETDMASEEQLHQLRDSFNEQHSGVRNAYKAMFLPKGVKKPANDVKFDDIGFDETMDKNRDKILAGFRVPKTILGAAESDTNRATAETADYVFARRTIKPKLIMICSYLNEFLVPRFGRDIYLTFSDPVPEDRLAKSTEMRNAVGAVPVITPNEARKEYLGLESTDNGDTILIPNNFVPIEDAGKVNPLAFSANKLEIKKVKKTAKPPIGYIPTRAGGKNGTRFARTADLRSHMAKELGKKIADILIKTKKKSVNEMTDSEYEEVILKAKRSRADGYTKEIYNELKDLNDKQKDEALRNLSDAVKSIDQKKIDVSKLFNLDKWVNLTISAITPIVSRLFKIEADLALEVIDEPGLDVENTPAAKRAIDQAMDLMSESYNQDTLDKLEAKLTEGLEQGLGIPKLADLVSDIYAWKDEYAAQRVALTESNRITNTAGKIAWKESGVVSEIKWVALASDPCALCQDLNGETISIDENFFDKGDNYEIGDERYNFDYSAVGGPPAHPNCRCGIKPIVTTRIDTEKEVDDLDEALADAALDDAINKLENEHE